LRSEKGHERQDCRKREEQCIPLHGSSGVEGRTGSNSAEELVTSRRVNPFDGSEKNLVDGSEKESWQRTKETVRSYEDDVTAEGIPEYHACQARTSLRLSRN
jgi:hypothetical protein